MHNNDLITAGVGIVLGGDWMQNTLLSFVIHPSAGAEGGKKRRGGCDRESRQEIETSLTHSRHERTANQMWCLYDGLMVDCRVYIKKPLAISKACLPPFTYKIYHPPSLDKASCQEEKEK